MKQCHVCVADKKNQNKVSFKDIEDFYRRTIFNPYLDDLLCSLEERFISRTDTIEPLLYVLPSLPLIDNYHVLKPAVQFYEEDLSSYQYIIEAKFKLCQSKWKTVIGSKFRPLNAIKTSTNCDNNMFSNMYQFLKSESVKITSGFKLKSQDLANSHYHPSIHIDITYSSWHLINYNIYVDCTEPTQNSSVISVVLNFLICLYMYRLQHI